MRLIIGLVVGTLAVLISTYLVPGVQVENFVTAIIVAIVLGVINTFVKPVLKLITLPLTVITLGLFLLVLNALLIMLVGVIVPGFYVENFWWALLFSIVISLIYSFLDLLTKD